MNPQMKSIVDVVLDRSPEELIGAVLASLVLALVLAGFFLLLRSKVSDTSTLVISLALGSNLLAMIVAAGYIRHGLTQQFRSATHSASMPPPGYPPQGGGHRTAMMAYRIFDAADLDADGLLTAKEAAEAASEFVKQFDDGDEERIDAHRLREAIRSRLIEMPPMPPSEMIGPPFPVGSAAASDAHKARNRHRFNRSPADGRG